MFVIAAIFILCFIAFLFIQDSVGGKAVTTSDYVEESLSNKSEDLLGIFGNNEQYFEDNENNRCVNRDREGNCIE